jgi:hypothetical protein
VAAHVELDFASDFDDGLRVMAVLEQRVFDGLRTADEQAAKQAVLFLGDPVAAVIPADEDDGCCRAARWRFDELHVGIPFTNWSSAINVVARGYEIERDDGSIS